MVRILVKATFLVRSSRGLSVEQSERAPGTSSFYKVTKLLREIPPLNLTTSQWDIQLQHTNLGRHTCSVYSKVDSIKVFEMNRQRGWSGQSTSGAFMSGREPGPCPLVRVGTRTVLSNRVYAAVCDLKTGNLGVWRGGDPRGLSLIVVCISWFQVLLTVRGMRWACSVTRMASTEPARGTGTVGRPSVWTARARGCRGRKRRPCSWTPSV